MALPTKEYLSGGTGNGRPIKVAATATPGTIIHTAHATAKDEIYIYAVNTSTTDVDLTLEFGGTSNPDDRFGPITITAKKGLMLIVPGIVLSGSLIVRAYAATANVINISGFVNRIP